MPASSPKETTLPGLPRITDIDRYVGVRIRERRTHLGLNQTQLGKLIGVSLHQVRKYETGQDRIFVGRLYLITEALEIQVAHLFPDQDHLSPLVPLSYQSMALDFLRNVLAIADSQHQQLVCYLARALAAGMPGEENDLAERDQIAV